MLICIVTNKSLNVFQNYIPNFMCMCVGARGVMCYVRNRDRHVFVFLQYQNILTIKLTEIKAIQVSFVVTYLAILIFLSGTATVNHSLFYSSLKYLSDDILHFTQ